MTQPVPAFVCTFLEVVQINCLLLESNDYEGIEGDSPYTSPFEWISCILLCNNHCTGFLRIPPLPSLKLYDNGFRTLRPLLYHSHIRDPVHFDSGSFPVSAYASACSRLGLVHFPCSPSGNAEHEPDIPDGWIHSYKMLTHGRELKFHGKALPGFPLLLHVAGNYPQDTPEYERGNVGCG